MWFFSRIVIIGTMQLIVPITPIVLQKYHLELAPNFIHQINWELFSHWDGKWYKNIVTLGYEYVNNDHDHNIAFFPLFPLVTKGVMLLGFSFEVAGTLVNNLAFLGAGFLIYYWIKQRNGIICARWVIAVLVWCPYSLFATVTYSEGLFLLLTAASLRAFEKRQHIMAACLGAMATGTRITGVALIPAFLLVAWKERRLRIAYIASFAVGGGLLLFSLYCTLHFGDPLAFVHAQKTWGAVGFVWSWLTTLELSWVFVLTCLFGYLLWHLRQELSPVAVNYGFCSLILVLASGRPSSIPRLFYGTVPLILALGIFFAQYPRLGFSVIGLFGILLIHVALQFSQWEWVG